MVSFWHPSTRDGEEYLPHPKMPPNELHPTPFLQFFPALISRGQVDFQHSQFSQLSGDFSRFLFIKRRISRAYM